jgi:hypothetical protein
LNGKFDETMYPTCKSGSQRCAALLAVDWAAQLKIRTLEPGSSKVNFEKNLGKKNSRKLNFPRAAFRSAAGKKAADFFSKMNKFYCK